MKERERGGGGGGKTVEDLQRDRHEDIQTEKDLKRDRNEDRNRVRYNTQFKAVKHSKKKKKEKNALNSQHADFL